MALWKARSLSPEQKVRIVEEESETKSLQNEESGAFLGLDDVSMSEVLSSVLSVPVSYLSLFSTYNCKCVYKDALIFSSVKVPVFYPFPSIQCL